jgi:hypothetical protein
MHKQNLPVASMCMGIESNVEIMELTILVWSFSKRRDAFSGCGWREVLRVRRVAVNILNKQ